MTDANTVRNATPRYEGTTDEGTTDEGTTDEGSTDAGSTEEGAGGEGVSHRGLRLDWPSVPGDSGASSPARRSLGAAPRRTRVVATIGPASDQPATLAAMQEAGMDVARLPLAHGSIDDAVERLRRVRKAAPEVAILVDLPGPKIRTTPFPRAASRC